MARQRKLVWYDFGLIAVRSEKLPSLCGAFWEVFGFDLSQGPNTRPPHSHLGIYTFCFFDFFLWLYWNIQLTQLKEELARLWSAVTFRKVQTNTLSNNSVMKHSCFDLPAVPFLCACNSNLQKPWWLGITKLWFAMSKTVIIKHSALPFTFVVRACNYITVWVRVLPL